MSNRYAKRGVSSKKEEVHRAIKKLDKGIFPKAFCKIIPDYLTRDPQYCLVMHADGAGTKSALAYMYWKETGDFSIWKGIAQDALVMNTDDLMCAGATQDFLISSTIGRNKNLIPGEVIGAIISGTESLIKDFKKWGFSMHSTGGETADVGDLVRTLIVDSTVVCRMKRKEVIDNSRIRSGDVIVGFASFGKARYEKEYNSGIGSNGLTSARHDVLHKYLKKKYPQSFDPAIPAGLTYSGSRKLTEPITIYHNGKKIQTTIGKLLLSPTRTYLPLVNEIFKKHRHHIHGMIHCSGGGQTKVLHFTNKLKIIKNNLFPVPPVFELIRQESETSWKEMYSVFNMGHRLEIYTSEHYADSMIAEARTFGIDSRLIGRVEKSSQNQLHVLTENGNFSYS